MQGMCISVRFDVSRLRKMIPDVENGDIREIDDEDIDELMDTEASKFVFDNEDDDEQSQNGGGDGDSADEQSEETDTKTNSKTESQEPTVNIETDNSEDKDDAQISNNSMQPLQQNQQQLQQQPQQQQPQVLQPQAPIQDFLRANLNPGILQSGTMNNQSMQSNMHMQPGTMVQQQGSIGPAMEVNHTVGGGDIDMEEFDLSAYGGVKPEFDIKQKDDDKAIENLNAQLFGLQTGGNNDKLEHAKTMGINQVLDNQVNNSNPMVSNIPQTQYNNQQQDGGLNFSFNNNAVNMQPPMQPQMQPPMMQPPMQPQMMQQPMLNMNGMYGGGNNQKKVSFDSKAINGFGVKGYAPSNIKVVELDTKISDGFLYSGSKNLDPFGNV
jgi:hypothetical protein